MRADLNMRPGRLTTEIYGGKLMGYHVVGVYDRVGTGACDDIRVYQVNGAESYYGTFYLAHHRNLWVYIPYTSLRSTAITEVRGSFLCRPEPTTRPP